MHICFKRKTLKKKQIAESPEQILANCKRISWRTLQIFFLGL